MKIKNILLTFIIFFLTGCSHSYVNSSSSSLQQNATLQVGTLGDVIVRAVDGVERPIGLFSSYEISPGMHVVSIIYHGWSNIKSVNELHIKFEALPGKTYKFEAQANKHIMKWSPIVMDANTKEIIDSTLVEKSNENSLN